MAERTIVGRVEILEQKVGNLEDLPARVNGLELQIVQLRGEMHVEFSAMRADLAGLRGGYGGTLASLGDDIRGGDDGTLASLRQDIVDLRGGDSGTLASLRQDIADLRGGDDGTLASLRQDITVLRGDVASLRGGDEGSLASLRLELREQNEETRRHALVLYEDLVARIAALGEGPWPRRKRR
jgi:hypothetical protein